MRIGAGCAVGTALTEAAVPVGAVALVGGAGGGGGAVGSAGGGGWLEDYEVVAVDYLALVFGAQLGGQPSGGAAHEGGDLLGVVVDQASGDYRAAGAGQVHRVAGLEGTVDAGDAGREQGGPACE